MSSINQFFGEVDDREEYSYRMLIYGNYTFREDLEKDSQVIVLKELIPYLSSRYKIHFTLLIPEVVTSLELPGVSQVIYDLPTYPNTMRTHFNAKNFLKIIDWKNNDFDIIYSHLPEHTLQISNCIYNNTNLRPNIVGYSHWFEVTQNSPYEKNMLSANLFGMLEMMECGVNSKWLKNLVLDEAKKHLSESNVDRLRQIIQPHYLGINEYVPRKDVKQKSVIFNHRDNAYTGWGWFCEIMDEIWQERQDFTVYSTMASTSSAWNKKLNLQDRRKYLHELGRMHFGVGCFQDYSAWSVSVTDGLSRGVPYLLPEGLCYPEMVSDTYPYLFKDRDDFKRKFIAMLDTPKLLDISPFAKKMLWEPRLDRWFDGWDKVFEFKPTKEDGDGINKIIDIIKNTKYISKKDLLDRLGWGVHIKMDRYRESLRNHPNVKLTKSGYEWRTDE